MILDIICEASIRANPTSTTKPSRQELLKEYEFCQNTDQNMEKTIWQTGAAMSLGLIAPILVVVLRPSEEQPIWYFACLAWPFMAGFVGLWWLMARRWWSVQHAMILRMRHSERKLGVHSHSYIQYLDHTNLLSEAKLSKREVAEIRNRSKSRDRFGIRRHQHWGARLPFGAFRYLS